jgi:Heme exporter protein D (CcmD)
MDWSAHNAGFVAAAYALSVLCVLGLVGVILLIDRHNARAIKKLEN